MYVVPGLGPGDDGAVIVVDVGTAAVKKVLDEGASAEWLGNDTLIVSEVTPVYD